MSDGRRDYSVSRNESFTNISTNDLENIIGCLLLDNNSDYELMNELLEVYEKRDGVPEIDTDAAWERFNRDYSGQGEIYLTEDADNPTQTNNCGKSSNRPRNKRSWLRRGLVAAVALIVIAALFFNTTAIGASLWQEILRWGRETLGFSNNVSQTNSNEDLENLNNTSEY
jgi:hypothetical protein